MEKVSVFFVFSSRNENFESFHHWMWYTCKHMHEDFNDPSSLYFFSLLQLSKRFSKQHLSLINHRPSYIIFIPLEFPTITFEELNEWGKNYPTAAEIHMKARAKWKENDGDRDKKEAFYGWVGILIVVINIFDLDSSLSFSSRLFLPNTSSIDCT